MACFAGRVESDRAARRLQGALGIAGGVAKGRELEQGLVAALRQVLRLGRHPILIEPRQQGTLVECNGLGQERFPPGIPGGRSR